MRKRALSTILAFMLVLGLFPATAFAAEGHWAQQAVDKLNGIYGDNVFTASDDAMTEGDAYSVLQSMDSASNEVTGSSTTNLTRGKACTILTEIFHIPTDNISAIQYLYNQNIINGTASGLDENGTVTKAQFAVLTYRVLNFVGGGMAESTDVLKPGTEEYFAWMYLAARCCVPFETTALDTQMSSATVKTIVPTTTESGEVWNNNNMVEKTGSELWSAWIARLTYLGVKTNEASYSESDTLIAAAMKLVKATGATEIFTDVQPGDWWYDGVMYLFNENIVQGQGDGTFGLQTLPRFQLAVLLATLDNAECANAAGPPRITGSVNYAIEKGYMTGTKFDGESNWGPDHEEWGNSVYACREDTVVAILKQQKVDVSGVNTSILDRFSDSSSISEDAKPYMAYAVSHGLISGTTTSTLSPDGDVNRPQIGVLAYRILISLDTTKMQDYRENISFVLPDQNAGQ